MGLSFCCANETVIGEGNVFSDLFSSLVPFLLFIKPDAANLDS